MMKWGDDTSGRIAVAYVLVLACLFGLYLAFDLQRSRRDSLQRIETHATAALRWAEKGMDAMSVAMGQAAEAGAGACKGGSVAPQVLARLLNVPVGGITISSGDRPLCEWAAGEIAGTAVCGGDSGPAMLITRTQGNVSAEARIYPACMLAPFSLAIEDIQLRLMDLKPREPAAGPAPIVVIRSAHWPIKVEVTAQESWLFRRWVADLPLQVALFAVAALVLWFGPLAMLRRRLSVEGQVRAALRRGEFFLTYLPTVEINTGDWLGVEALMRWRHGRHGLLQPAAFIPWIERSPLIHETTSWVLHQAADDLARMNELHGELYVGINLPPTQLGDERVVDAALAAFGDDRLSLCRVMFELTEREAGDYASPVVQRVVARLRERGAQFALDDFGIGFSNLSSLHVLDVDFIKVDKTFIQELERRGSEPNVVDSIVLLAREFGVGIIAEGIETERQLDRIRRIGIRMAQGFLFFRPMELEATLAQLRLRAQ
ncbi:EAL domain-containing protein [Azorhizobium doebereinerae]|uniref:EAL domain-containing protein n=1 Tax=Azorhizobium doebereinerae TaxID=281091 RepID=UPI0003F9F085|nr:EAL domain-containing protein [Azorhizobium doebereinerae]